MVEAIYAVLIIIGWFVLVAVTYFIWTAVKTISDNSMTKHKKVCDMCFRDIKKWHELNKQVGKK